MSNEPMTTESHHATVKTYLLVFGGLAFLTALTVSLSYLTFSRPLLIAMAGTIAACKVLLIASFFMHLRFERKGILALLGLGLFFVLALAASLIRDIGILK